MLIQQIAPDKWENFCETYSRIHRGWLVSLYVGNPNDASQLAKTTLAQNVPLQEIREAHTNNQAEIMITVGNGGEEKSFLLEDITALFEETEEDKDVGLRIDNSVSSTFLQFRIPAQPQQLDGIAQFEI